MLLEGQLRALCYLLQKNNYLYQHLPENLTRSNIKLTGCYTEGIGSIIQECQETGHKCVCNDAKQAAYVGVDVLWIDWQARDTGYVG